MKRVASSIFLVLLLCGFGQFQVGQRSFRASSGSAPIAPVNAANAATCISGGGCTTTAANMSGATLLVVSIASYICPGSAASITDSSGNTYVQAVAQNNYPGLCLYYSCGAAVSTSMTFSASIVGGYLPGVAADGYSSVKASSCADGAASVAGPSASPVGTGSVTPSVNNDLCVAVGVGDMTSSPAVSFASPSQAFTTFDQVSNGSDFSVFTGYYVQTTAAALSTSFTTNATPYGSGFTSAIQCFLHA